MDEHTTSRYEVVVEQGSPHGDLYELEQTTYHRIVDRRTNRTVMVFESEMEASLSRDTGLWDDYHFSGVAQVTITPDQRSVLVTYHDGREEALPLVNEEGELDLPAQSNRGTMP